MCSYVISILCLSPYHYISLYLNHSLSPSFSLSIFLSQYVYYIYLKLSQSLFSFLPPRIVGLLNLWHKSEQVITQRPELIVEHFVTLRNHHHNSLYKLQSHFVFYHAIIFSFDLVHLKQPDFFRRVRARHN